MEAISRNQKAFCPRCGKNLYPVAGYRGLKRTPAWGCPLCNKWLGDRVAGKKTDGMSQKLPASRPYDRIFGIEQGEELVMLKDCRGEAGYDLYAVPAGIDNPQDAVNFRRVAYWDKDGEYGEWIFVSGEPSGVSDDEPVRYIGEAY